MLSALKQKNKKTAEPVKLQSELETKIDFIYTESELGESSKKDYKEKILDRPLRSEINLKKIYDERLKSFLESDNRVVSKDEEESQEEYFEDREYNEQAQLEKNRNEGEDMSDIDEDEKEDEQDEEVFN